MIAISTRSPASLPLAEPPGRTLISPVLYSDGWGRHVLERQFEVIATVFGRHGGLWSDRETERRLRSHVDQPISMLAHWIVERKVLTFFWRRQRLLPAFQFDRRDMSLRPGPQQVFAELVGAFDDFDVASWFATANVLLGDAAPLERIDDHLCCVLAAARLDRFVAKG